MDSGDKLRVAANMACLFMWIKTLFNIRPNLLGTTVCIIFITSHIYKILKYWK